MKMGAGLFWGLILIAIGISIIFKVVFDVSIGRIVVAIIFILIGLKILIGKSSGNFNSRDSDVIFDDRMITEFPTKNTEFNTIFGKTTYNFKEAAIPTDKSLDLEFNTVFGNSVLILPPGLPVRIKGEAVFGSVRLPNNNAAMFGSATYVSHHDSSHADFVNIKASTVFGNIDIIQNRPSH